MFSGFLEYLCDTPSHGLRRGLHFAASLLRMAIASRQLQIVAHFTG
jgi:hypothetical protein